MVLRWLGYGCGGMAVLAGFLLAGPDAPGPSAFPVSLEARFLPEEEADGFKLRARLVRVAEEDVEQLQRGQPDTVGLATAWAALGLVGLSGAALLLAVRRRRMLQPV